MSTLPDLIRDNPLISQWFRIHDGRLIVKTGRVELGQGNQTALLQMTAQELGVSPDELGIEMARTDRTVNEGYTAGSMSISVGGVALRWAAAALRAAVLEQAAKRLGADGGSLDLMDGAVIGSDGPTGMTLVQLLPEIDLGAAIDQHTTLRGPRPEGAQADIPRIDLADRIAGAPFLHDMAADGMLFGAPLHPPSMTASLIDIDIDAIRARPGVVEVTRDGSHIGVVAISAYAAARAAAFAARSASWRDNTPSPNDPMGAIATSDAEAPVVFEREDGPPATGEIFETTTARPYLSHGSIGPSAGAACWQDGKVTVWSHSQGVFQLRNAIAEVLKLPREDVTVVHAPGAGCYGHNGADDAAFDAVLMARAVPGRRVHVTWSRRDELTVAPLGPGMVTTARATVGEDGRIAAMDVTVNSAPHANRPGAGGAPNLRAGPYLADPTPPALSKDLPMARGGGAERNAVPGYDIPNVRVRKRIVHLPYRTSSLRSLGAFANVFAIETLFDDIAADKGRDPVAFRLDHLSDPRARAVIERVAANAQAMSCTGEGVGCGLAYARYKNTAGYCAVVARVEVEEEVRVTDVHSVADIGEVISRDGAINQIEGGIVQAASWTLKEAAFFSGTRVGMEGWPDYPILRFSEVPRVRVELIEPEGKPPLGCGEVSQGPTAAAIGNAVFDALGVRVRSLPITRDAVIAAQV